MISSKAGTIRRDPNPLMLPQSTIVMEAAQQMRASNVGAVLVGEGDARLVGIFTEHDAITRVLADGRDPRTTTLGEVMTFNPDIVRPDHTDMAVLRMMQIGFCRHLPIVQDDKVIGMASLNDFHNVGPAGQ